MKRNAREFATVSAEQVKYWIRDLCPMPEKEDIDLVIVNSPQYAKETEITVYWKNCDDPTSRKISKKIEHIQRDDLVHVVPFLLPGIDEDGFDIKSEDAHQAFLYLVDTYGPAVRRLRAEDRLGVCSRLIMFLEEEQASHEQALESERTNKRLRLQQQQAVQLAGPDAMPPNPLSGHGGTLVVSTVPGGSGGRYPALPLQPPGRPPLPPPHPPGNPPPQPPPSQKRMESMESLAKAAGLTSLTSSGSLSPMSTGVSASELRTVAAADPTGAPPQIVGSNGRAEGGGEGQQGGRGGGLKVTAPRYEDDVHLRSEMRQKTPPDAMASMGQLAALSGNYYHAATAAADRDDSSPFFAQPCAQPPKRPPSDLPSTGGGLPSFTGIGRSNKDRESSSGSGTSL